MPFLNFQILKDGQPDRLDPSLTHRCFSLCIVTEAYNVKWRHLAKDNNTVFIIKLEKGYKIVP